MRSTGRMCGLSHSSCSSHLAIMVYFSVPSLSRAKSCTRVTSAWPTPPLPPCAMPVASIATFKIFSDDVILGLIDVDRRERVDIFNGALAHCSQLLSELAIQIGRAPFHFKERVRQQTVDSRQRSAVAPAEIPAQIGYLVGALKREERNPL